MTNNEMEKIYETLAIKIDEFGIDKSNIFFALTAKCKWVSKTIV